MPRAAGAPQGSEVDQLYALPLSDFTRARNALAAQLREAGRAAEAAAVARLTKPSPPVWAINQVARAEPAIVETLVEATERLKLVQAGRHPGELGPVVQAQRAALARVEERIRERLTEAGFRAGPGMMKRVSGTLLGAAADQARRSDLRAGRVTGESTAPAFEVFTGALPAELTQPFEPTPKRSPLRGESPTTRRQRERIERAQETLRVASAEAEEWGRRAEDLEHAATEHRTSADDAVASVEALRRKLAEAEAHAAEERRAAEQATREAERARRDAERAAARLKVAEEAIRAARGPT